jgi:hypothetical protein
MTFEIENLREVEDLAELIATTEELIIYEIDL